jgi:PhnB protein
MQVTTYLNFNGSCEEAFTLYAKIFGGVVQSLLRWSEMPGMNGNSAMANKIMHASLRIGECEILGADSPPERFQAPAGFNVTLNVDSITEAERIFAQLAEGGTVTMTMGETFFARRFGMAIDRFGIPWMVVATQL